MSEKKNRFFFFWNLLQYLYFMNPIVYLLLSFLSLCSLQPGFCYRRFLIKYKWYSWRAEGNSEEKRNPESRNIIASWQKTMEGIWTSISFKRTIIIFLFVAFVFQSFLDYVSTRKQPTEIERKLKTLIKESVFISHIISAKVISY
jgi:hypothetical protein